MTQLATRELANGHGIALPHTTAINYTMDDVWAMAERVHQSKLFPNITNAQSAFVLMLLCQADGLHPMQVLRIYDIIDGKPAMKSAAIMAKFQESGGLIKILKSDATEARALFSHPRFQPEPYEIAYTIKDAQVAGLAAKKNWRENPADMLWWRLVAKGVRKIHPGIVAGIYSVDEVRDMSLTDRAAREVADQEHRDAIREAMRPVPPAVAVAAAIDDPPVVGFMGIGFDARNYLRMAGDAVEFVNAQLRAQWSGVEGEPPTVSLNDLHKHLFAIAIKQGYLAEPMPTKLTPALKMLDGVYRDHRVWVRETITAYLEEHVEQAIAALAERYEAISPAVDDGLSDSEAAQEFGPGANG